MGCVLRGKGIRRGLRRRRRRVRDRRQIRDRTGGVADTWSGKGEADAVPADSQAVCNGTLRKARALQETDPSFRRHGGQVDQNHEEE